MMGEIRINVVTDDQQVRNAQQSTGLSTKRDKVDLPFKTLIRLKKQSRIRELKGKLQWDGDLDWSRLDQGD
jgi:Arc/MetJ family transcription regulator